MFGYHGGCGQRWLIIPSTKGYNILSACSGRALDVYAGSQSSGTNVQTWQQNHNDNQAWDIQPTFAGVLADGVYSIAIKANGDLRLEANNGMASGDNVRVSTTSNSDAQKWQLTGNTDGTYFITNVVSGLSLDVYGGYTSDETNIQVFTLHHGQNQKWKIDKNDDGTYSIRSAGTGKSLDLYAGIAASGTNIQQFSWHGGDNQRWKLVKE